MGSKRVFGTPHVNFEQFDGSLGEFVLKQMRSLPQDDILQINGESGEQITCGQLLTRAISVAQGLRLRGIGKGDVVVTLGEPSFNLFAATLGSILQNAPILPAVPTLKQMELEHLFEQTNPKIIFVDNTPSFNVTAALSAMKNRVEVILLDSEPEPGERLRNFDDILEPQENDNFKPPAVDDLKNEIAAILSSSGTTGLPKAVLIPHVSFVYEIQQFWDFFLLRSKSRYLLATQTFWYTGIFYYLHCCCFGYSHIFFPKLDPKTILYGIEKFKPEWTFCNPTYLHSLVDYPDFAKYDVSSLRMLLVGGSALPKPLAQLIMEKWPAKNLMLEQLYGGTEVGFVTSPLTGAPMGSVGKLIDGMVAKVVDLKSNENLGPNQTGELRFKCPKSFMKGYLNEPEGTAAAFDEEGFYRTGDIGYITEDNFIYISGRIKDLIKVKGHQVAPIELEVVIMSMKGVREAAVVGRPHPVDIYHPVAAVVKEPNSGLTEEDIVTFVAGTLADHKHLVGGVQFVDALPRNSNGKIVKRKVAEMLGIK